MEIVCAEGNVDVVSIEGPDAAHFLQGQMSADVTLLGENGSTWSFLLEPTGKCGFWGRLCATGPDRFGYVLPAGNGELAAQRLSRFLLRTDAAVSWSTRPSVSLRWEGELVGASAAVAGSLLERGAVDADDGSDANDGPSTENWFAYDVTRSVHSIGLDVVCAESVATPLHDVRTVLGEMIESMPVDLVEASEIDRIRIESQLPEMGVDIVDGTLPAATGMVNDSASFTKGCYTGQELVARMDSRAATSPELLMLLRSVGSGPIPGAGTAIEVKGSTGRITSSAPAGSGWVALGYVPRSVTIEPEESVPAVVAGATAVLMGPAR